MAGYPGLLGAAALGGEPISIRADTATWNILDLAP